MSPHVTVHCFPERKSNNSVFFFFGGGAKYFAKSEAAILLLHILPQEQWLSADVDTVGYMLLA